MMWRLVLEFVITAVLIAGVAWVSYRQGYRQAMRERLEALAKNARQKANQATADALVLEGAVPPRVRRVRFKGTSRQGRND